MCDLKDIHSSFIQMDIDTLGRCLKGGLAVLCNKFQDQYQLRNESILITGKRDTMLPDVYIIDTSDTPPVNIFKL